MLAPTLRMQAALRSVRLRPLAMMNETGPEFDPGALKGESLPRKDIPLSEAFAIGYRDGVAFERERCAKIAETEYRGASWHGYYVQAGDVIAAKIRNPLD